MPPSPIPARTVTPPVPSTSFSCPHRIVDGGCQALSIFSCPILCSTIGAMPLLSPCLRHAEAFALGGTAHTRSCPTPRSSPCTRRCMCGIPQTRSRKTCRSESYNAAHGFGPGILHKEYTASVTWRSTVHRWPVILWLRTKDRSSERTPDRARVREEATKTDSMSPSRQALLLGWSCPCPQEVNAVSRVTKRAAF